LKQVIVRKPKMSAISDDTCFLTVRPSDMAALKAMPETEIVEQVDNSVSALVEDSDNEEEYKLPPPDPVVEKVVETTTQEEPKKKKVVSKKKADA
jgi:hypothetical protein